MPVSAVSLVSAIRHQVGLHTATSAGLVVMVVLASVARLTSSTGLPGPPGTVTAHGGVVRTNSQDNGLIETCPPVSATVRTSVWPVCPGALAVHDTFPSATTTSDSRP